MKESKVKEIVLGEHIGGKGARSSLKGWFARVWLAVAGSGDVDVNVGPAANDDSAPKSGPQIGDKMSDGTVYAGVSKTTRLPFYVAPKDSGVCQWIEAKWFAAEDGWRLPSINELDQLYDAKDKGALKGTFNVTGSNPAGWYWSSSKYGTSYALAKRFSDGFEDYLLNGLQERHREDYVASLRCVR